MPLLTDYKLLIPRLFEQDWENVLHSSQGVERELIVVQAKGAYLLRDIDEEHVSVERLGWLCLWSKAFAALEVVSSSLINNAKLALQLTARNVFELVLHTEVLLQPLFDLYQGTQSNINPTT